MIFIKILLAWLLADFLAGLVHWWEDRVLLDSSKSPMLNLIIMDNDLHHRMPTAMLKFTLWENISTSAPYTFSMSAMLWFVEAPLICTLAVFFATFANIIHRWAHTPTKKRTRIVRLLQASGLFISPYQHNQHHYSYGKVLSRKDASRFYCPMTSWLNPILEAVNFFGFLEWCHRGFTKGA